MSKLLQKNKIITCLKCGEKTIKGGSDHDYPFSRFLYIGSYKGLVQKTGWYCFPCVESFKVLSSSNDDISNNRDQ